LKSGTVMENSKLPLQVWMMAFMFMSATKKGFSCLEFQRQLGLSRYETAFKLMHKIRAGMGRRDSLYQLKDMVEYDEGYVEVATKKQVKKQLKRGKGSQRQAKVAVAAESIPIEDSESGQQNRVCGYFKMEVLVKVDSENVNQFIKKNTDGEVVLFTDRNTAYANLEEVVNTHFTVVSSKKETNETLRWVHKAISNLKRNLLGIYHMITYKY
ncbi:IS1595 family transposase, partial [Algoriphagus sp. PAP.12]|uniref:IS1595 family transposase n=1 Tax=Algoriphagus sp. PAP.12 TaxID=2996678 RepID=UPI00227B39F8